MESLNFLDYQSVEGKYYEGRVKKYCKDGNYRIPSLFDCYDNPSDNKKKEYERCINFILDLVSDYKKIGADKRIKDFGVIANNAWFFTFAAVIGVYATAPEISGEWLYDIAIIITPKFNFKIIL